MQEEVVKPKLERTGSRSGPAREGEVSTKNSYAALEEPSDGEMMSLVDSETDPGADMSGSDQSDSEEEKDLIALLKDAGWRIARGRRRKDRKGGHRTGPPVKFKVKSEECGKDGCGCRADREADRKKFG